MIGIYDSGIGGIYTAELFKKILPEYNYKILADTAMFPLWEKSQAQIKENTFRALHRFFDQQNTKLVIIACNTAASCSIRDWQSQFPEKKVLSITIPWIEEILQHQYQNIWVLATKSTILSGIYNDIFTKLGGKWDPNFEFIISSDLITEIENNHKSKTTENLIKEYCKKFSPQTKTLILWCTHFSIVKNIFEKYFDGNVIDPSEISAKKLKTYLLNHPEIEQQLTIEGNSKNKKDEKDENYWDSQYFITQEKKYSLDFLETIKFSKIKI